MGCVAACGVTVRWQEGSALAGVGCFVERLACEVRHVAFLCAAACEAGRGRAGLHVLHGGPYRQVRRPAKSDS